MTANCIECGRPMIKSGFTPGKNPRQRYVCTNKACPRYWVKTARTTAASHVASGRMDSNDVAAVEQEDSEV